MKALPNPFGIPLAIFVAFTLSGCLKAIETIRENPGEEIKACRVEKILTSFNTTADDMTQPAPFEVDFHYNSAGQPIDMLASFDLTGPQDYYHFRYDKIGRLRDYIVTYSPTAAALLWHRYTYLPNNMIRDSFFAYGSTPNTAPNPDPEQFDYFVTYQLDAKGRVVKAIPSPPTDPSNSTLYVYDARGNLVRPGVTYDDKVNPYRTSTTWMFIYQDYSVNNPSTTHVAAYNAYGLPTDITNFGIFASNYSPFTIQYSCSMAWK